MKRQQSLKITSVFSPSDGAGGGTYEEGVAAVSADHPHPLRLDGQSWLGGLLLRDHHHGAQVDDASAAGGEKQEA